MPFLCCATTERRPPERPRAIARGGAAASTASSNSNTNKTRSSQITASRLDNKRLYVRRTKDHAGLVNQSTFFSLIEEFRQARSKNKSSKSKKSSASSSLSVKKTTKQILAEEELEEAMCMLRVRQRVPLRQHYTNTHANWVKKYEFAAGCRCNHNSGGNNNINKRSRAGGNNGLNSHYGRSHKNYSTTSATSSSSSSTSTSDGSHRLLRLLARDGRDQMTQYGPRGDKYLALRMLLQEAANYTWRRCRRLVLDYVTAHFGARDYAMAAENGYFVHFKTTFKEHWVSLMRELGSSGLQLIAQSQQQQLQKNNSDNNKEVFDRDRKLSLTTNLQLLYLFDVALLLPGEVLDWCQRTALDHLAVQQAIANKRNSRHVNFEDTLMDDRSSTPGCGVSEDGDYNSQLGSSGTASVFSPSPATGETMGFDLARGQLDDIATIYSHGSLKSKATTGVGARGGSVGASSSSYLFECHQDFVHKGPRFAAQAGSGGRGDTGEPPTSPYQTLERLIAKQEKQQQGRASGPNANVTVGAAVKKIRDDFLPTDTADLMCSDMDTFARLSPAALLSEPSMSDFRKDRLALLTRGLASKLKKR